jgi:protein-S-isoprenylcysteine O-methyltransferase Ste14
VVTAASPSVAGDQTASGRPCRARCLRLGDEQEEGMARPAAVVLYALVMVVVIVGVDLLFFRDHAWERLVVNVGIVLVFAAFYLRFLRPS